MRAIDLYGAAGLSTTRMFPLVLKPQGMNSAWDRPHGGLLRGASLTLVRAVRFPHPKRENNPHLRLSQ